MEPSKTLDTMPKLSREATLEYKKLEEYYAKKPEATAIVKAPAAEDERSRVEGMARSGVKRSELARWLGIKDDELDRRYGKILDRIEIETNMEVSKALKTTACDGNVKAAELWLMNNAGWRRTPEEGAAGTCKLAIQINLGSPTVEVKNVKT